MTGFPQYRTLCRCRILLKYWITAIIWSLKWYLHVIFISSPRTLCRCRFLLKYWITAIIWSLKWYLYLIFISSANFTFILSNHFHYNHDWFPPIQNPLPLSLLTYKGDLNLSLRFVSPENIPGRKKDGRCGSKGSLHVLIKQARNLTAVRANGSSDPFCKGYVAHRHMQ